jgi:hypothetical protein
MAGEAPRDDRSTATGQSHRRSQVRPDRNGTAATTLTILALAWRQADHLLAEMKAGKLPVPAQCWVAAAKDRVAHAPRVLFPAQPLFPKEFALRGLFSDHLARRRTGHPARVRYPSTPPARSAHANDRGADRATVAHNGR